MIVFVLPAVHSYISARYDLVHFITTYSIAKCEQCAKVLIISMIVNLLCFSEATVNNRQQTNALHGDNILSTIYNRPQDCALWYAR